MVIYGEIGPGDRVSLVKLSIEKFEKTGVPLRVAIDISIWNFQIQAGQGGTNPALRTLYYRLLRLLSVSIQPLFVFDGPHKPPVKRNKRTGHGGASIPDLMSKELLKLFGFAYHIAPGEAEAECALLQREGIVDAVLSEDVDTLMFGSGLTFRNWSAETTKAKIPTHVNVYDAAKTKAGRSGLDREGMILVALMSGGDYKTEGIPGCGVKVACEAARAGFGKSLCQIPRADTAGYEAWRNSLAYELKTNESKFFKVKRKAQQIPEDFPDRKVLGYYTHPVVSSAAKVQRLKEQIVWDGELDIQKLRAFVADAFEWKGKEGVKKFVRGLAPALLVLRLRQRGDRPDSGLDDLVLTKLNEMALVRSICGQREHISTDGMPEMRVIYHPLEIVGIDPDEEQDDDIHDYGRDGLAPLLEDDQIEAYASDDAGAVDDSPRKRGPSLYDPTKADKLWVAETLVKIGAPLTSEDYDESLRDPRKFLKQKATAKKAAAKTTKSTGGMRQGALEPFVQISKTSTRNTTKIPGEVIEDSDLSREKLPPAFLAPALDSPKSPIPVGVIKRRTRKTTTANEKPKARQNPWDISQSSSSKPLAPITKPSHARGTGTPTEKFQIYQPSGSPDSVPEPPALSSSRDKQKRRPNRKTDSTSLTNSQPLPRPKPLCAEKLVSPTAAFQAYTMSPSPKPNSLSRLNPSSRATKQSQARRTKRHQVYDLSTSPEVENDCIPTSTPPPKSASKRHSRRLPVPLNDDDERSPATDLPRYRSQEADKPFPRKKRSPPHSATKPAMHSSPTRRTPLTPQPVNRQINFALHSSAAKSSASTSSYNTAPSQIIDLSSPSPRSSPLAHQSSSPYPLNARTPIPKSNEITDLPSPEQQYIHDMGLHQSIIHNLNSSERIPASVRELDVDEQVYLADMGLSVEQSSAPCSPVPEVVEAQEMEVEVDMEIESEVEIVMNVEQELDQGGQKKKDGSKKRYIMLRESLPGFWREVGREELVEGRSRAWRGEEVEVVDLTEV
ncbi:flap structure-specific endonuclease protein [Rutstroemia sp. NJR-2017a BVV2]|nr:flap structure-specific endonuclease protein [Rutstroemia sp. NJR-2017a BVV2]